MRVEVPVANFLSFHQSSLLEMNHHPSVYFFPFYVCVCIDAAQPRPHRESDRSVFLLQHEGTTDRNVLTVRGCTSKGLTFALQEKYDISFIAEHPPRSSMLLI